MRRLRTVMPVLVVGAASVAFVGVCAALMVGYADATVEEPPAAPAVVVPVPRHGGWVPGCGTTPSALGVVEGTEVRDVDPCVDATSVESGDGADVSDEPGAEAARGCPRGREHGGCVSAVASGDAGAPNQPRGSSTPSGTTAPPSTAAPHPPTTTTEDPAEVKGGGKGIGRDNAPVDPGNQGNGSDTPPSQRP